MFTSYYLRRSSPFREHVGTGKGDHKALFKPGPAQSLREVMPALADMLLLIPKEIDDLCDRMGRVDWGANPRSRKHDFSKLDAIARKKHSSPATIASVLAFSVKHKWLLAFRSSAPREIRVQYLEFCSINIGPCWDAFVNTFETWLFGRSEDMRIFAKLTSRFLHFFQAYQFLAERTENNQQHAEKIAQLLFLGSLKYCLLVQPHKVGERYSAPKMVLELMLAMFVRHRASKALRELLVRALAVRSDYTTLIKQHSQKAKIMDLVFGFQRDFLDHVIEIAGPSPPNEDVLLIDIQQAQLLDDVVQASTSNTFGTDEATPYCEAGVVHVHFIFNNETNSRLVRILIFEGRMKHTIIATNITEINFAVSTALDLSASGDVLALSGWRTLADLLRLKSIPRDLEKIGVRIDDVQRVHVYPDGSLWNVPWAYLFLECLSTGPVSWRERVPAISVRHGSSTLAETSFSAKHATLCGAWQYGKAPQSRRRGACRDAVFDDLPAIPLEIEAVRRHCANQGLDVSADTMTTAESFLNDVGRSTAMQLVHLAGHGSASPGGMPTLWLPRGHDTVGSYSALHPERVMRISWSRCELLFINACFGASGAPFIGGPSIGFAEPFCISGLRRILAPLRPVGDEAAYEFADAFYEQLFRTGDSAVAFTHTMSGQLAKAKTDDYRMTVAAYNLTLS